MAFIRPEPSRFQRFVGSVGVACRVRNDDGKQCRLMEFRLGVEIVKKLGWANGTKIDVLWGDGSDFGKVRLVQGELGVALRSSDPDRAKSWKVASSAVQYGEIPDARGNRWRFEMTTRPMVTVAHKIVDGGVVITVPRDWFVSAKDSASTGNGNTAQNVGDWAAVDNGPRWSHAMVAKYDQQRARRERNP